MQVLERVTAGREGMKKKSDRKFKKVNRGRKKTKKAVVSMREEQQYQSI